MKGHLRIPYLARLGCSVGENLVSDSFATDRELDIEADAASLLAPDGDDDLVESLEASPAPHATLSLDAAGHPSREWRKRVAARLLEVNKELWLILSLLVISFVLDYLVASSRVVLGFYTLPTLYSAYCLGRRHATLTALASICLVVLLARVNADVLNVGPLSSFSSESLSDLMAWGGMLMVTAYAMGTLYERNASRIKELRETYQGVLMILRQFISKDKYTENHSYRVSVYAATIATYLNLPPSRIEDIRTAGLLHDIGKLDVSRELLHKAAGLSKAEYDQMQQHVAKGGDILGPVSSSLHGIIPIVLAHHDRFDGKGERRRLTRDVPMGARIIAVADVYDALSSDRPYRKAMSPFDARETIIKGSGSQFDPMVVTAFLKAFSEGALEIPEIVV